MKPGGGVRLARLLPPRTNDALEILLLSHRDLLRPVREHPPPAAKPSNEGPQVPNPRIRSPLPPHRTFAGKGLWRLGAGCRRRRIVSADYADENGDDHLGSVTMNVAPAPIEPSTSMLPRCWRMR